MNLKEKYDHAIASLHGFEWVLDSSQKRYEAAKAAGDRKAMKEEAPLLMKTIKSYKKQKKRAEELEQKLKQKNNAKK